MAAAHILRSFNLLLVYVPRKLASHIRVVQHQRKQWRAQHRVTLHPQLNKQINTASQIAYLYTIVDHYCAQTLTVLTDITLSV